jgi:hypothetical protein
MGFKQSVYLLPFLTEGTMQNSKKIIALKFIILVIVMLLISMMGFLVYRSKIMQTSDASYIDKMTTLKNIEGRKAVFIGGSATHFGVHAETFQNMTGISAVNMGLNAGVPFRLYVSSVEPYLNSGDILFVTPEYFYYSIKYTNMNENGVNFLVYFNNDSISSLKPSDIFPTMIESITVGWKNWGYFFQETIKELFFKQGFGIYYRKNSNKYGDFIGHKGLGSKTYSPSSTTYNDNGFIVALGKHLDSMAKKGVKIILLFPPYVVESYDSSIEYIEQIYNDVLNKLNVRILYDPDESCYPAEMFYDTVYHLKWDAAEENTRMIARKYMDLN